MRACWLLIGASACTPWIDLPEVEEPGAATTITAGQYMGEATLEVRAFAGPVRAGRELCTVPILLTVDGDAETLVTGRLECTFESLGQVRGNLTGDLTDNPLLVGALTARTLNLDWDGWFTSESALYGEMIGEAPYDALDLEYVGWLEAERIGPLDTGTMTP